MLNFWKKKQTDNNAPTTVTQSAPRTFGPTKKKKNTYVLSLKDSFFDATLFSWCKETPLAILTKNGKPVQEPNSAFQELTPFPNPMAVNMVQVYNIAKPVMGTLASTVVEYLDKETNKPVLMLFPHTTKMFIVNGHDSIEQAVARLNHASRRDLQRQLQKRAALIDKINQQQKQK